MIGRGADVTIIEPDQELSGFDRWLSPTAIVGDESGNVRRDGSDVAANVCVVGTLEEAVDRPPILAIPRSSAGNGQGADDEGRSSGYPPQRNVLDAAGWLETDNGAVHCCLR